MLTAFFWKALNEVRFLTEGGRESKTVELLKRGDLRKSCVRGVGISNDCVCLRL